MADNDDADSYRRIRINAAHHYTATFRVYHGAGFFVLKFEELIVGSFLNYGLSCRGCFSKTNSDVAKCFARYMQCLKQSCEQHPAHMFYTWCCCYHTGVRWLSIHQAKIPLQPLPRNANTHQSRADSIQLNHNTNKNAEQATPTPVSGVRIAYSSTKN